VKLVAEAGVGTIAAGGQGARRISWLVSGHDGRNGSFAALIDQERRHPMELGVAEISRC
jgi:glutamate synthase domain-containing protein 2